MADLSQPTPANSPSPFHHSCSGLRSAKLWKSASSVPWSNYSEYYAECNPRGKDDLLDTATICLSANPNELAAIIYEPVASFNEENVEHAYIHTTAQGPYEYYAECNPRGKNDLLDTATISLSANPNELAAIIYVDSINGMNRDYFECSNRESEAVATFNDESKEEDAALDVEYTNIHTTAQEPCDGEQNATQRPDGNAQITEYRNFLCDVCGKLFKQSSHLWQHLRFHSGVKPFGCTEPGCARGFTIRSDLNDHMRKCHTGERPHQCEQCGKRFLTSSVRNQHRLMHGQRQYRCGECGKRFYHQFCGSK